MKWYTYAFNTAFSAFVMLGNVLAQGNTGGSTAYTNTCRMYGKDIAGPGKYCLRLDSLGGIDLSFNGGSDALYQFISSAWYIGAGFVGLLAVLFLVWAGIQKIVGKEESFRRITSFTIAGLVLYFGAAALFTAIAPLFYEDSVKYGDKVYQAGYNAATGIWSNVSGVVNWGGSTLLNIWEGGVNMINQFSQVGTNL